MNRPNTFTHVVLVVPVVLSLAGGCMTARERVYLGTWRDVEDGARHDIQKVDGRVQVTQVVDGDGEAFEVMESTLEDGVLTWKYLVPSTDYVVTYVAGSGVVDGRVEYTWSNVTPAGGQNEGTGALVRSP